MNTNTAWQPGTQSSTTVVKATPTIATPQGAPIVKSATTATAEPHKQDTSHQGKPKATRPLTRKQAALVQHIVNNPKDSATKAYKAVYGVTNDGTAAVEGSKTLRKPNVMAELAKYSNTAEVTLVEVMQYSNEYGKEGGHSGAAYAGIARQTAQDILDRIHGKATQRIEQQTSVVSIAIDLTGATAGDNA